METETITCGCGGADGLHPLGINECYRKFAFGNLVPTNFRREKGINVCDVNGYTITVYTLRSQRLYHNHGENIWSLPKDESSVNSIQMND